MHQADDARAKGTGDLQTVLICHADLARQRHDFLTAVYGYNLDVAEYALTVADPTLPNDRLVGMLIPLKKPTPTTAADKEPTIAKPRDDDKLMQPALPAKPDAPVERPRDNRSERGAFPTPNSSAAAPAAAPASPYGSSAAPTGGARRRPVLAMCRRSSTRPHQDPAAAARMTSHLNLRLAMDGNSDISASDTSVASPPGSREVPPGRRDLLAGPPPLRIGPLTVDPPVLQAPMAGFTNYAYRQVVREFGGAGLQATEMIYAQGFLWLEAPRRGTARPAVGRGRRAAAAGGADLGQRSGPAGGGRSEAGPRVSRQRGRHQFRLPGERRH